MYAVAGLSSFLLLFSGMALFLCDEAVKEGACLIHKTAKRAFFISKFNVPSFNLNLSVCVLYNLSF